MVKTFEQTLDDFLLDRLDPEELRQFLVEVRQPERGELLQRKLMQTLEAPQSYGLSETINLEAKFQEMLAKAAFIREQEQGRVIELRPQKKFVQFRKLAVAAAVVGLILMTTYLFVRRESSVVSPEEIIVKTNDVQAPDKNRAQIKLADGTVIYLDSAGNGELASVNGVQLLKTEDGKIEYSRESGVVSGELDYNTLSNPRGSKVIDMTLSDGSRVWLNAGSSVTYPVAFIGNERKVSIDGEAYFEISRQTTDNGRRLKTFIVEKGNMQVEVLGTHFNVNAYDDEREIKVTLLEGSVRVQSSVVSSESKVIKPGEQAKVTGNGQLAISKGVDVEAVMAWKNGLFQFERASLQEVMRQLARWYNVEVIYEGVISQREFGGKIKRTSNLSSVLRMLEASDVNFRIEGNKLIVVK